MKFIFMTVNSHSQNSESRKWSGVKGQIIARFRKIKEAATLAGCHPNSFRLAANGECPRIRKWLEKRGIKFPQ